MNALFRRGKRRKPKEPKAGLSARPQRGAGASPASEFLDRSRLVETGLFALFAVLVILIAFLGQEPKQPEFILGQPAPTRLTADFAFDYESEARARMRRNEAKAHVAPRFQRTFEPYRAFETFVERLTALFARVQIEKESGGAPAAETLPGQIQTLLQDTGYEIEPEPLLTLARIENPSMRSRLVKDALTILQELYRDGIYAERAGDGASGTVTVIQIIDEEGRAKLPDARSLQEARVALRVRINALAPDTRTASALYAIFDAGLSPNLLYSPEATQRAIQAAADQIEAPTMRYEKGDTLVEPGTVVGALEMERVRAYREAERSRRGATLFLDALFLERAVMTVILLTGVLIYLRAGMRQLAKRNQALLVTGVAIVLNLALVRLLPEIGHFGLAEDGSAARLAVPFLAPFALAPIVVAVLVGATPGVLAALVISVIHGMMRDNSMEFFLIAFLAGTLGSFISMNTRKRGNLVRSGLITGGAAAIAAGALALGGGLGVAVASQQMLVASVAGLFTGILAAGLLPIFEQVFKITTEITLLELTDYNHPLLRRMQIEAPGTYHHSLVVANLAENAAAKIGARPLLCRVCSLFHDAGKLVKPDYFVENQRGGSNPHLEKNPSMSALVIKAHVKEGVELARKHRLPKVVIDVIRQHHGTSLIQYFYYEAKQRRARETPSPLPPNQSRPKIDLDSDVDETTYRYDGPKPLFKESAIIFLADSVEAASRSLRKITQPALDELIDDIIQAKIEDGQLDLCPLTFQELHQIRGSFSFTLLNMLHARIEYPKDGKQKDEAKTAGEARSAAGDGSEARDNPPGNASQPDASERADG